MQKDINASINKDFKFFKLNLSQIKLKFSHFFQFLNIEQPFFETKF